MAAPINPKNADSTNAEYVETQTSHGFTVRQAIYNGSTGWALAQNNSIGTLGTDIVAEVLGVNQFRRAKEGEKVAGFTGLTRGSVLHSSPTVAGGLAASATQDGAPAGAVARNPLGEAISATEIIHRFSTPEAI